MLRVGKCIAVLALWHVACALHAHPGAHASLMVLDQLIATNPASQALRIRRAALLSHEGLFDEALTDLEQARTLADPGAIDFELGVLQLRRGRLDEARLALDRWLQREPRDFMALLQRARTFGAMGQTGAALQDYEAYFSLAVAPNPGDYLAAARLVQHEDPVQALRVLDAGLARLGEVVSLQKLAVTIERRRGRPDGALARWEELGDALHHGPAWQVEFARLLLLNGRDADALQTLRLAEEQLAALRSTPARDRLREQIFSLRDAAGT